MMADGLIMSATALRVEWSFGFLLALFRQLAFVFLLLPMISGAVLVEGEELIGVSTSFLAAPCLG